jgi:hypothetical protein
MSSQALESTAESSSPRKKTLKNTRQADPTNLFVPSHPLAPHTPVRPALRIGTKSPQKQGMRAVTFHLENPSPQSLSSSVTPPGQSYQWIYVDPSGAHKQSRNPPQTPTHLSTPRASALDILSNHSTTSHTDAASIIQHNHHGRSIPRPPRKRSSKQAGPKKSLKTRDIEEFFTTRHLEDGSVEKTCTFCEYVPTCLFFLSSRCLF